MENITYGEFINNILDTRGRFNCGEEYHERHHIIPKCMGGSDEEDNLIDLFAREHFEAHRLLAQENPYNEGLIYAWNMMAWAKRSYQQRCELTPEEYEEVKIALSQIKKNQIISIETRNKQSQSAKARCTDEWRCQMSQLAKERFANKENHPMYGRCMPEETRQKISTTEKGKIISMELRARWSKTRKEKYGGENHPLAKQVVQLTTDDLFVKVWNYMKQASDELNIDYTGIKRCVNGTQKTAGGFKWKSKEEYDKILELQNNLGGINEI